MSRDNDINETRRRRRFRYLVWTLVVLFVSAGGLIGFMLYAGAMVALRAEDNLHAAHQTIRLVEQFVHDNGRWPKSWQELEAMKFPSDTPSPIHLDPAASSWYPIDWPARSAYLKERIAIDFDADVEVIIQQDRMQFEAIKPIGSTYQYRNYGHVESLQKTLKQVVEERGAEGVRSKK